MTGLEIWLLAIGLAMDCFAVSIASGIILKRVQLRPMLIMALAFGFFQALMPLLGWIGACDADNGIGFRLFSGTHAIAWLDRRQFFQPSH